MRCASLDTPIPYASDLEDQYLAKTRLEGVINNLLAY
jgi:2-oxoisovalerate dehydrogenase E1 component